MINQLILRTFPNITSTLLPPPLLLGEHGHDTPFCDPGYVAVREMGLPHRGCPAGQSRDGPVPAGGLGRGRRLGRLDQRASRFTLRFT